MTLSSVLPLICIALALWAAATDYLKREIADAVTIGLVLVGVANTCLSSSNPLIQLGISLSFAFTAGFFFLLGNQGGGDIKMAFGSMIAVGAAAQEFLIGVLVGAATITILAWWFSRKAKVNDVYRPMSDDVDRMPLDPRINLSSAEVPFGVCLATGLCFAAISQMAEWLPMP